MKDFGFHSETFVKVTVQVSLNMNKNIVIEIKKQGFEILEKSLELYNKVLDQTVPWKSIAETVKGFDRYLDNYSMEASVLIGEIKTLVLDTTDSYFSARQSIYEWCSLTKPLLATYKTLFSKHDDNNFMAQKQLLLKVLDDGMKQMTAAHVKLEEVYSTFNLTTEKLAKLHVQLANDFDSESEYIKSVNAKIRRQAYGGAAAGAVLGPFGLILSYSIATIVVEGRLIPDMQNKLNEIKNFYKSFNSQVDNAKIAIKNAKTQLDTDIKNIEAQSAQNATTTAPLDMNQLHDDLIGILDRVTGQCEEFKNKTF